jgi:hypothetical protein
MVIADRNAFASKRAQRNPIKNMLYKKHNATTSPAKLLLEGEEFLEVIGCKSCG